MLHAKKYVLCNPYTFFHKADRPAAGIDCAENPIGPGSSWSWPGDRGRREAHKCCLHAHREQRLVIIYYSVRLRTSPRSTVCGATRSRRALRSTAAAGKSLIPHPLSLSPLLSTSTDRKHSDKQILIDKNRGHVSGSYLHRVRWLRSSRKTQSSASAHRDKNVTWPLFTVTGTTVYKYWAGNSVSYSGSPA
jgi:hypothetical protein